MNLTIFGEVASKKNSKRIVRMGNRTMLIGSKAFMAWHEEALKQAVMIRRNSKFGTFTEAEVTITFYFGTKRRCDLSNKAESIMDLLVDAEVLLDDSWQVVSKLTLISGGHDKELPRAEIVIQELKEESEE